ncbi:nascent polypeptide-associated complex subunit alpha, muscle-specific form-like isoform X8 [Oncorhynchus masou masou]|uniref:nascent polypeptide-associated complex subunit alpha, muscle-specific form-like isoform X8 n=1 Tax=Oncorhynchus masou masou TaxID=90313 RepID=UPI003183090F
MGQLLSWIRAPRDNQALQDVAVEQQSQPRQYSPTSVAQLAVNPAQFESASAASTMATKPGAVSVTMGGATASGATGGGSPTTAGTTQRGTAKVVMPETAFVSPAGATIIDIPTPGTKGSPKDTPKPAPMHPAKATPLTTGGGNIVVEATTPWKAEVPKLQESSEQTAKSVPTTSSKVDMAKKDPAKLVTAVAAPAAAAGDASLKGPQTKVQVEVVPPGAKAAKEELAVDPFDALADSLPSSESFAPAAHVYTGPEVIEHGLTSKKGVICGGNDCPLPPGYRFEDMAPVADVKPKDVPKPMSTDEALDSLSFGFTTSMAPIPQKQEKKVEDLAAIDALSAGFSNFAPPPAAPIKKAEEFKSAPVTKSPAPPVDKKAKVEKFADDFSLMSGLDSPLATKPKTDESVPTTSSKVDMAKKDPAKLVTAVAAPAAAAGDASLKGPQTKKVEDLAAIDALSAGFSNFAPPLPAPIKKAEEFKSAPFTKSPAPPVDKKAKVEKKPMSTDEALDSLSFGFTTSMPPIPQKQEKKVEDLAAIDALSAGFSNFAPPPPAPIKVQVEVVPPGAKAAKEPAPMHPAKATPLTTGGGNIVGEVTTSWKAEVPKLQESPEQTAKSVPTTSSKVDMAKKDPAKLVTAVAAPAAAAGDASLKGPQTKVQVEVVPPGAKAAKEPAPMHPAKATPLTTGGGNIVGEVTTPLKAEVPKLQESPEQTAKSVPTTSSKVDMAKKDPAKLVTAVAAPAAAAGDASLKGPQTKVQVEVIPPGAKAAKEPAPMHPAKATPLTTGGGNIVGEVTTPWKAEVPKLQESPEQTAKSVPTTSSKVDMAKKDPAKLVTAVAAPAAAAGDASLKGPQTKELTVDPFDALADSLPSSEFFAPAAHVYTGPEVIEHGLTSKKGVICGGNDCPLPPGYRFEDMTPVADVKPKDVPKPMSTDEALDSLSFGFTTSMAPIPQKQEKKVEDLAAIDALSAGFSNFAPPPPAPIKKAEEFKSAPVTKSPAPPVDKKAKVEKKPMSTDETLDSLSFGFTTSMPPIPQKQEKKVEDLAAIDALSAGFSNFAPPPPAPIKVQMEVVPPGAKAAKEPAPMHPAKATPLTTRGGNIVGEVTTPRKAEVPKLQESSEQTAKSVPTTSSKVDMAKKDPAKLVTAVAAPAAAAGDASLKGPQTKVQVEVVPPGAKVAKEPAPVHPAKATPLTTGGGNIVGEVTTPWKAEVPKLQESPEQTAKSVPTTSSKVDMAKKDPAKLVTAVAAPAAAAGDASLKGPQTKELTVDPFDALADSLPSSESFAPAAHVYTGPEVIEHGLTSKKGVICGGNDCPLPPGYRFEDMTPVADVKPKDVPKPMSTDEALDSLSFGFTTSMAPIPQKQEKKVEDLAAIDALSAGFSNFAPPPPAPIKKAEEFKSAPFTKSPAPPVDKKAKVEKFADDFSLMSGLDSPLANKAKTDESVPTTSSKVDMAKKDPAKLVTAVAAPAAAAGDASLKGPQTKKVEDLAAIDALSAGFSNFAPPLPAPIKKAEEFKSAPVTKSPAPPVDKKAKVEKFADDFSLMSGLDSPLDTKQKTDGGGSMSLDALSALGDSLPAPEAAPEPPKIRHEDIVTEGKLTSKKGVFVGERDDTLPPKYRFTENKVKDLPPLKPEPSMDSGEALEILSGDFMSSCVAPAVHAPVLCPPAPPTQASDDFALDALAGDFVAPAVAPAVKSAVDHQLSRGTVDALDTLSDSLMDKAPIPEPAPVSVRDIVKEKKVIEEKLTKVGERDDSLPAEYRHTEKDRKARAEAKVQADVRAKQPLMDDSEALDLLSRDLSSSAGPAAASVAVTTEQRQPKLEPMSAPVLDDLAGTLLPDTPEFKSKGDKPKSKSRSKSKKQRKEDPSSIDHLSGQLSSDVVSASTNKDGKT